MFWLRFWLFWWDGGVRRWWKGSGFRCWEMHIINNRNESSITWLFGHFRSSGRSAYSGSLSLLDSSDVNFWSWFLAVLDQILGNFCGIFFADVDVVQYSLYRFSSTEQRKIFYYNSLCGDYLRNYWSGITLKFLNNLHLSKILSAQHLAKNWIQLSQLSSIF